MREIIIIKKVYKIEELNEKSREKAMYKIADFQVSFEWWESVFEDAREIGLIIEAFDISGRYSCKGIWICNPKAAAKKIIENHGKKCATYKDAEKFLDELNKQPKTHDGDYVNWHEVENLEDDFKNKLLEDYRIILKNEYDYLTGEEAILDTIQANGYDFDENGNLA